MSYVSQVSEEQADAALKKSYAQITEVFGFLPNYFQALGRAPRVLESHVAFSGALLADGALSRALKEEIGLVVSGINSSSYCIAAHMEILRTLGVEKALGKKLVTDYAAAPVAEKDKALFRFADKLTREPFGIRPEDVAALRQAGWDDAAILECALAASYFNFVNRVSSGLGLVADF